MSIRRVIVDASPLIVLFKSQQADLLPQLFTEIIVPSGVWDEVTRSDCADWPTLKLLTVSWVQRVEIDAIAPEVASFNLGKGESQVLILALKNRDSPAQMLRERAVVDDRSARRWARSLDIVTIGTGRLLILAKQRGVIPLVSTQLQRLRDARLWLSDNLANPIKQQAGE